MPRASRRRRSPGRGLGRQILLAVVAAVTVILVIGSLVEVRTESRGYHTATTRSYGALAVRVAEASQGTGARLSALMAEASGLPNRQFPYTARAIIQQGLDSAVREAGDQATEAVHIASPPPSAGMATGFTQVMEDRALATSRLRSTVDELLGMDALPVAGAPSTSVPSAPATLISVSQASAALTVVGTLLERADDVYRGLRTAARTQHPPVRLPASIWVPHPVDGSPLGAALLGGTAATLSASTALVPFHHLVITAVGLTPPAVASGGAGVAATTCIAPASAVPGPSPAVLPPTTTLVTGVTVTNCGTVPETNVAVTVHVAPGDPPGSAPPPVGSSGGTTRAVVSIASGSSVAPGLAALPVALGHRYTVAVSVTLPPGQVDPTGTTQRFLVHVAG